MSTQGIPSKEPRYMRVARELLEAIMTEQYPAGTLLPHEAALCDLFGVSRTTIREALRQLSGQGLVEKLHGVGTIVRKVAPRSNYVVFAGYTDLIQHGRATLLNEVSRKAIVTDTSLAGVFGCGEGERWIRITGVRSEEADPEHPVSFLQVFIPERFGAIADDGMDGGRPYHQRIQERYGIPLQGVEQEIGATAIDDAEKAGYLRVPIGSPGLHVVRRFYGPARSLMQCTFNTHPAGRFVYSFNLNHAGA